MECPGTLNTKTNVADFTWSEVANAWRAANQDKLIVRYNQPKLPYLAFCRENGEWAGFTKEQANEWLEKGYAVKEFEDVHAFAPHIERRRVRPSSEGDLMYDAFLSGSELPFITKNRIKSRPGIEIEAELGFLGDTSHTVIQDYLVWLNRVAYTAEARGSDVALRLANRVNGMIPDRPETLTRITVKRPGEWLDMTSWSPILSPAGYRGFMFFARILHAELDHKRINGSMGSSNPTGHWGAYMEDGILRITVPCSPSNFPEETMTETVKTLIQEYR